MHAYIHANILLDLASQGQAKRTSRNGAVGLALATPGLLSRTLTFLERQHKIKPEMAGCPNVKRPVKDGRWLPSALRLLRLGVDIGASAH